MIIISLYCESAETISLLDKIPFIFHWDKIKVHWILNFADNTLWKLLFCCRWSCFCGWRKPENSGIKCFLLPIHTVELINLDNMYTFWLVFILFYAWYNVMQDMIYVLKLFRFKSLYYTIKSSIWSWSQYPHRIMNCRYTWLLINTFFIINLYSSSSSYKHSHHQYY